MRGLGRTVVLIAVAAVFVAIPASAQVVHRVHVGGPDACEGFGLDPGCDANFSLVALEFADGSVSGTYTDRFGGDGETGFHARIDCIAISGNEAWVSGVIKTGTLIGEGYDELAGLPVWTRVRDNGTSSNETPDEIGFSFIGDPRSCLEMPDESDDPNFTLFAAPQGQVMVN